MNGFQKGVKVFAYLLAGFIILAIISGITFAFSLLSFSFDEDDGKVIEHYSETFSNIEKIDVDLAASELLIEVGEEFQVSADNVSSSMTTRVEGRTLKITEESHWFWNANKVGKIRVTVPSMVRLDELDIEAGAGKVVIDEIHSVKLDLEQGAGLVQIMNSSFFQTKISGGAGKIEITDSSLQDLDLEAGVGNVDLKADITGNSKIECGVGSVRVTLSRSILDYRISALKGLGSISIQGKDYDHDTTIGDGMNSLKIEGGVGSIRVDSLQS